MAGQTPQFEKGTVTAVNEGGYTLDVLVSGREELNVSYNPLAYIPRRGEKVWVALVDDDLWVMGVASARDEKAPNSKGECAHSVSTSVRITSEGSPRSAWARDLSAGVGLVVWQTSGDDLELVADATLRPFLQMTHQGPNP